MRLGVRGLPRSVARQVGLTRLAFSGEMLRSVQLQDELLALADLQVLDISANLAEQLPSSVLLLTGLRELHAGMNRLGMAAHDFSHMEELQVLVLASNKLLALHGSVWGLTALRRLDLGHNNLTDLPQSVSSLTGLTVREAWCLQWPLRPLQQQTAVAAPNARRLTLCACLLACAAARST